MEKTQIQVSDTTAETLHGMKQRGESYNDVLDRILNTHIDNNTLDLEHLPDRLNHALRQAYKAGMEEISDEPAPDEFVEESYYYWKDGNVLRLDELVIEE